MKVKIIEDNCIGCGQCERICENVFELQDDGLAHVINNQINEELVGDVRDAIDSCPTNAIEEDTE